jgi:hypothetical protein
MRGSVSIGVASTSCVQLEQDSIEGLTVALRGLEPTGPVVLQVKRDGTLTFVAYERD